MRRWLAFLSLLFLLHSTLFAQGDADRKLLQKLDSIKNSPCISRHFASIYFTTTQKAVGFFKDSPVDTKNFIELFGKLMLKRWRKRQMKLAILFYNDPGKFKLELEKLHQRMERIDHLILRNL